MKKITENKLFMINHTVEDECVWVGYRFVPCKDFDPQNSEGLTSPYCRNCGVVLFKPKRK